MLFADAKVVKKNVHECKGGGGRSPFPLNKTSRDCIKITTSHPSSLTQSMITDPGVWYVDPGIFERGGAPPRKASSHQCAEISGGGGG